MQVNNVHIYILIQSTIHVMSREKLSRVVSHLPSLWFLYSFPSPTGGLPCPIWYHTTSYIQPHDEDAPAGVDLIGVDTPWAYILHGKQSLPLSCNPCQRPHSTKGCEQRRGSRNGCMSTLLQTCKLEDGFFGGLLLTHTDKRLEAFKMQIWRRMEKIGMLDKVTNEEVPRTVNEERQILNSVWQRKHRWIGQVLRHD